MQASSHVQLDNERVVVTEWIFSPGAQTGNHRHERDYVVVPLTTGVLQLVANGSTSESRLETGVSYTRVGGVEHNVVNPNGYEFRFIEIELK
jgi:quercetin dioxygenase-like cupin family protein